MMLKPTKHSIELNTEYIFGLFSTLATSKQFSLLGVPVSYDFSHFAAQQNIVSVALIVNFYYAAFNITVPLEIDVWVSSSHDLHIYATDCLPGNLELSRSDEPI